MSKRRVHDGIVGVLITLGMLLGWLADPLWYLLPLVIGVALLQSAFTGFCPVYFILDKVHVDDKPGTTGI